MRNIFLSILIIVQFTACNQATKSEQSESKTTIIPSFSADSAYNFIQNQVDFGPRIPNSQAHISCAKYLSSTLEKFGAKVVGQKADLIAFDGTVLHATNIIGSFNENAENRILLFAHWDTRPWSDHDLNPLNRKTPVTGANDGASGVGVLLELARQFKLQKPEIGIDIIFFDAEDYGTPENISIENSEETWCLGSQYWAKNPHSKGYRAKYGILLDMVGAQQATFLREQISEYYAMDVVNKVWSQAKSLGFGQYFLEQKGGAITDDHLYINKIIGIPSINIIHYSNETGFVDHWHTIDDTMKNIDKNTLNAVGTTLLHVIYNE